jgi:adenine-specific DNA methylase
MVQLPLLPDSRPRLFGAGFPATRYQGSKRKLLDWIWEHTHTLPFDSVLDVFGGTGAVSFLFKVAGKQVIYNDHLHFNHVIGRALIENATTTLTPADLDSVLAPHADAAYPQFIQQTFHGIYYTDAENAWLDRVIYNIDHKLNNPMKQALARFALFQACLIKRPYNLFHRANLYMRTASVKRSFGNKTTWDTPFDEHFLSFAEGANRAVFDNQRQNTALCLDALDTPQGADLVYLDPPYLNQRGVGVDYRNFYHFLEGLTNYATWMQQVDYSSKHRRLRPVCSVWAKADTFMSAFEALLEHHRRSILVVSYRSDGLPTCEELVGAMRQVKSNVREFRLPQKYALSTAACDEVLLIGA